MNPGRIKVPLNAFQGIYINLQDKFIDENMKSETSFNNVLQEYQKWLREKYNISVYYEEFLGSYLEMDLDLYVALKLSY